MHARLLPCVRAEQTEMVTPLGCWGNSHFHLEHLEVQLCVLSWHHLVCCFI